MKTFGSYFDSSSLRGLKKLLYLIYQNLFELVCLNVCFIICCLPFFTVPFAIRALGQVLANLCSDTCSKPFRTYWSSFIHWDRRSFFTLFPAVVLDLSLGFGLLLYLGGKAQHWLYWVGCGINIAVLLILLMVQFYLTPLLLRTTLPNLRLWKTAFGLSMLRLPYTLATLAAVVILWILVVRYFQRAWIAFVLLLFSLSGLIITFCADHWVRHDLEQSFGESKEGT